MAKAEAVHESINAVGRSATETRQLLQAVLAGDSDYRFVELNASTYQAVRVTQVMLMRKVETCTFAVAEGSTGASLTIAGRLLPDRLERVRKAVSDRSPAPAAESSAAGAPVLTPLAKALPVVPVGPPALVGLVSAVPVAPMAMTGRPSSGPGIDETIHRSPGQSWVSALPPASPDCYSPPTTLRYELRFDNGEKRVLTQTVVIGRDPSAGAAGGSAQRVVLEDAQVSKAHASLGVDEQGVWVEDLHSTNGTFVHVHGQATVSVLGGRRHRLQPGSVVRFGTRFVTVARAD